MIPFRSNLILCLLHAILAFVVIYVMTSGGMGISIDSESYLVSANRFVQQRWESALNPTWPPLYPLSIAGVKTLGVSSLLDATRVISIISFVVLVVTTFLVGSRIQGRFTGHLSAVSATFLAPLLYLYCFCWSETIYIMFSLLFFLILIHTLLAPSGLQTKHLILSGIFAGLATITRYIGYSLIGTGILSILFLSSNSPGSRRFKKTLIFLLSAITPLVIHYLIHFSYYGLAGKIQFPSEYSFLHQLSRFILATYHDFLSFDLSFWKYVFFFKWGLPFFWLRMLILLCMLILFVSFFKAIFSSKLSFDLLKPQIGMIFYFVLYTAIILFVSSRIAVDPIGSRFTAPLYPFILLLVFSSITHVHKTFPRKKRGLILGLTVFCVLLFWGIQIVSISSIYKGVSSGSFPAIEHPGNLNRESLKFLKANADASDIVITNIYSKLSLIWPRQEPYPGIPHDEWENAEEEITREASRHTIYVLLCTEDFTPHDITVEDIEKTDQKYGLFLWKKTFGNDYIYRTKPVVFLKSQQSEKKE